MVLVSLQTSGPRPPSPPLFQLIEMPLEPLRLRLQQSHAIKEKLIALKLPRALNTEDKMIADPAQLHLIFELVMPETFSADRVFHWIGDYSHLLASFLINLQINHATREATLEFPRFGTQDWFCDLDVWRKPI